MRNLKKFLALALALMMAMSLMATASAAVTANAGYPDDGYTVNPSFDEAVTVLSGMGVIQGYDGGTSFGPQRPITRAEAAMMLYRIATGDTEGRSVGLYAAYGNFDDVKPGSWYAGAVGYCANYGIIKGRPDGLFYPSDNVTGYEILAMILRVVGYDKNGEFSGGSWAYNVATLSTSLGVKNKVNSASYGEGTFYQPATREVVASLLFETITTVPMVTYSEALRYMDTGMEGGLLAGTAKNPTVGYNVFGLRSNCGIVVGNEETGEKDDATKIGFDVKQGLVDGRDVPMTAANSARVNLDAIDDTLSFDRTENYYNSTTSSYVKRCHSAYVYESDTDGDSDGVPQNVTLTFKWESGLDSFGHKVKVWYSDKSSTVETAGDGNKYQFATGLDTYAVIDQTDPDNIKVVHGAFGELDVTKNSPGDFDLGKKANFDKSTGVYWNYAFGPTQADDYANKPANAGSGNWASDDEFRSPIRAYNNAFVTKIDGKTNTSENPRYPLYLAISNHPDGYVDMIVALELTITQIAQVNNVYTDDPSIGVFNANSKDDVASSNLSSTGTAPWTRSSSNYSTSSIGSGSSTNSFSSDTGSDYFNLYGNVKPLTYGSTASTQVYTQIAQANLVGQSSKDLKDKVVAIAITGTKKDGRSGSNYSANGISLTQGSHSTADTITGVKGNADTVLRSNYFYKVSKLANVVPATVWSVDTKTKTVTLSDGSKMERSPYANVVDASFAAAAGVCADDCPKSNTTYLFTLDREGRYLYWERTTSETNFVYATYLDYGTPMSSSTFTYEITYTDSTGEQRLHKEVTKYNDKSFSAVGGYNDNPLPKRDANTLSGTIKPGRYTGYVISGTTLTEVTTRHQTANDGKNGGTADQPFIRGSADDFFKVDSSRVDASSNYIGTNGVTTVTTGDALAGAKQVADSNLFLTENTVFHIVKGAGTDTQEVKTYKGLSDLVKDCRSVEIKGGNLSGDTSVFRTDQDDNGTDDLTYAEMIYFSTEPFLYAQSYGYTYGSAEAAKEVFIPADAVSFNKATSSSLYFVGDNASNIINAYGANAVQFTMYKDGVEGSYWIEGKLSDNCFYADSTESSRMVNATDNGDSGKSSAGTILNGGKNVFYGLEATGSTTSSGETIYKIVPVAETQDDANETVIGNYFGTTTNGSSLGIYNTTNAGLTSFGNEARYVPTTNATQAAFIDKDVTSYMGTGTLYNVEKAVVKSATDEFSVSTVRELSEAGSLYDNMGVPVSCVLNADSVRVVDFIYVNAPTS